MHRCTANDFTLFGACMSLKSSENIIRPPFLFNESVDRIDLMDLGDLLDEQFEFLVFIHFGVLLV